MAEKHTPTNLCTLCNILGSSIHQVCQAHSWVLFDLLPIAVKKEVLMGAEFNFNSLFSFHEILIGRLIKKPMKRFLPWLSFWLLRQHVLNLEFTIFSQTLEENLRARNLFLGKKMIFALFQVKAHSGLHNPGQIWKMQSLHFSLCKKIMHKCEEAFYPKNKKVGINRSLEGSG